MRPPILDRANTLFATTKLEPFAVKGKAEPVQARSVGRAEGSRTRQMSLQRLPLTGRNADSAYSQGVHERTVRNRPPDRTRGRHRDRQDRLLEALRDAAAGFKKLRATCEAYTSSIPYVVWRELLREMLPLGGTSPEAEIIERDSRGSGDQGARPRAMAAAARRRCSTSKSPTRPRCCSWRRTNRRTKLHETVARFLEVDVSGKAAGRDRRRASHGQGLGRAPGVS